MFGIQMNQVRQAKDRHLVKVSLVNNPSLHSTKPCWLITDACD